MKLISLACIPSALAFMSEPPLTHKTLQENSRCAGIWNELRAPRNDAVFLSRTSFLSAQQTVPSELSEPQNSDDYLDPLTNALERASSPDAMRFYKKQFQREGCCVVNLPSNTRGLLREFHQRFKSEGTALTIENITLKSKLDQFFQGLLGGIEGASKGTRSKIVELNAGQIAQPWHTDDPADCRILAILALDGTPSEHLATETVEQYLELEDGYIGAQFYEGEVPEGLILRPKENQLLVMSTEKCVHRKPDTRMDSARRLWRSEYS